MVNTHSLPPLIYASSLIDVPPDVLKEINDSSKHFIWEGKNAKIDQNTLIKILKGGPLSA